MRLTPLPMCTGPHVIDPPLRIAGQRFGRSHCDRCGYAIEVLLREQRMLMLVHRDAPTFWTNWRTPRTDEVARG